MSDYDAVLAALDEIESEGALSALEITYAAVAYARAAVAHRQTWAEPWFHDGAGDAADDAQEAAWRALRDAVVATLAPPP